MTEVNHNGSTEPDVIEGDVVAEPRHELVPVAAPALAVTPQVQATELVARLSVIREAQDKAMVKDVDYGEIPGTNKPTLLKPGAEKLSVLFQLDVQLANEKVWGPGEHLTVISHATVFHAPSGARLGYGEGICTTRERKYAKRKQERACPACGAAAVIKGKAEYGGGWLCWKKRDGCGATWPDGAAAIEGQETSDIDNPDLPDLWNTVVKMAEKRARVDAVLAVTGASALFTQDVEDQPQTQGEPQAEAPPPPRPRITPPSPDRVTELEKTGRRLIDERVWDANKMISELVAAGATDATNMRIAFSTMPAEGAEALASKMADALAAEVKA